jgi:hypothetical protein
VINSCNLKDARSQTLMRNAAKGNHANVSACKCCCQEFGGLPAHTKAFSEDERKTVHTLFPPGMSCMEIIHSEVGKKIWKRNNSRNRGATKRMGVMKTHAVVDSLKRLVKDKLLEALETNT